jgi:hypothetical protein
LLLAEAALLALVRHVPMLKHHLCRAALFLVTALAPVSVPAQAPTSREGGVGDAAPTLSFRLDEGRNINSFTRERAVAAHLLLRSGNQPRVLVAFPAGNSGVGVWFAKSETPVSWTLVGSPRAVTIADAKGRPLRGIEAELRANAPTLAPARAVLSSVRVLRDYEALGTLPDELMVASRLESRRLVWARDRLDGAAGYRLSIEAVGDTKITANAITPGGGGSIQLKLIALTGEAPLTPLGGAALLSANAARDARSRDVLSFLSYREKYLAGSWRFDTYFGRDTLMSLTLLAPALKPPAIERGMDAVLERLAPNGEVAHEEDIGEFAILRNAKEGRGRIDRPIYDYGMVDDDFMLAPLAARWLLGSDTPRRRAQAFLAAPIAGGGRTGDALVRNLQWVVQRTAAFAADPVATKLVGIKAGRRTGQWRDSEEGLGRGVYPYDVNVALVPAALDAIDRLLVSGLLNDYTKEPQRRTLQRARQQWEVWSEWAAPLFVVSIPSERARASLSSYGAALGVPSATALEAVGNDGVTFNALSLDDQGRPVPVMHSDDGFALLFDTPPPDRLERAVATLTRPFPAGLSTPIGMLVANPVFAGPEVQSRFTNGAYHGTVVWSWQQALMVAGLGRQLARADLPDGLRVRLASARAQLWSAIDAAGELRSSELWSWSYADGRYRPEPFGVRSADADESNAAQLWSTVFLALPKTATGTYSPSARPR